jgi:UDP-glucose 6-dehydrogenase
MHSPEFLREVSAKFDTANPDRNIVGIPADNKRYREAAKKALAVMPKAPFELICSSEEAELVKYGGDCWLYVKVVFVNILHDLSHKIPNVKYETVRDAMKKDPRIGDSHLDPIHKSGRGAGGHCFIKDFAAFTNMYEKEMKDAFGTEALRAFEKKNKHLLKTSGKDLDLLRGVYGDGDTGT